MGEIVFQQKENFSENFSNLRVPAQTKHFLKSPIPDYTYKILHKNETENRVAFNAANLIEVIAWGALGGGGGGLQVK